jgi:HEPN domain-containing protein
MTRSQDQVVWDFVQSWLRKAEGDPRAAGHLLEFEQDDCFAAAFHAHQAAEKLIKAFLVRHQIYFPKTHDIQRLLDLAAQPDPALQAELASASMLTPFGVEFRYPGTVPGHLSRPFSYSSSIDVIYPDFAPPTAV